MSIELNGRRFTPMNMAARPFRVDAAQVALLQELGLDRPELLPDPDEDSLAYIGRMNAALIATNRIPDVLAYYLLPLGASETDWSADMARQTAEHIGNVTDERERALVYELGAEFVFGFFVRGVAWLGTSQSYLRIAATAVPNEKNAARSIWARGRRWFASFRTTTTTAPSA